MTTLELLPELLKHDCRMTGPERIEKPREDVLCYVDPYGSRRYIREVDGQRVAVLQVMVQAGKLPLVANVFTLADYRRQGHATYLIKVVWRELGVTRFSTDLSMGGLAWVESFNRGFNG